MDNPPYIIVALSKGKNSVFLAETIKRFVHGSNKDVTKYLSLRIFQSLNEKDSITSSAASATLGDTS